MTSKQIVESELAASLAIVSITKSQMMLRFPQLMESRTWVYSFRSARIVRKSDYRSHKSKDRYHLISLNVLNVYGLRP